MTRRQTSPVQEKRIFLPFGDGLSIPFLQGYTEFSESIFVSLIVAGFVISFILRAKRIESENRQLHSDLTTIRKMEEGKEILISELKEALQEVKRLSGLLPICSSCKKIRDDRGYWNQIESYLEERSEAEFSHSICPDCSHSLYGKYFEAEHDRDRFSYEIDTENSLIQVRCNGLFRFEDICNGAEKLYADPLFDKGMNSIVDLTEAWIDPDFENVRELVGFVESKAELRGKCKIAVIVSCDLMYGVIRMFGALSERTASSIRPFRGYDDACKWIGGEERQ